MLTIEVALNPNNLRNLKMAGADPIIFRDNPHEVYVFTKQGEVISRIRQGMNWSSGEETPDEYGYCSFVYTRLDEAQLHEHLRDPTKHQGSDD